MHAMLVDDRRNLVWTEVPEPTVGPEEVLVDIRAAALNRADLLQRQGKYPSPPGCPPWMGLEVAGIVREAGPVARTEGRFKPGDAVCALLGGGGYAERVAVRHDMLLSIPKGLSLAEASALPEACATSYLNLFIEGDLQPGDTAYIPAGASGLASIAIPMAKAFGARVVTSVLTDELVERIRPLGADVVVNSAKESVAKVLEAQLEAGHPVSVAMDCLSGESLGDCLPFMAHGGRWVVISTLAGVTTTLPLRALLTRGIKVMGSMLRNRTPEMKARILRELEERVWPKIESGAIRPTVYRTLPMARAEEAHGLLERGENVGKVVLTLSGED